MTAPRNIALYGGTFDPVHLGHLAVARAARQRFALDQILLVPAHVQPLKAQLPVTSFHHRYAMLSLALKDEPQFVPSMLDSPETIAAGGAAASYTVETIARARQQLGPGVRLFFLIGMDAFRLIAKWREPVRLLRSAEFIVASRPGFPLAGLAAALPAELRPSDAEAAQMSAAGRLECNGAIVHLLPHLHEEASATAIRAAALEGHGLEQLVPGAVAEYIRSTGLYNTTAGGEASL
jgi:nicotinate-nucleotide adenylyltransferase